MKRAVVAGHICLDIIPGIDHAFDLIPGRLYEVGAPLIGTGGAVSNTGVAFHILGIPTTLMGKIGDDSFGEGVLGVLRTYDDALADGMVMMPGVVTSYTVVVNIPGSDRIFLHCPGANADFLADDIQYDALDGASLFHFGYPALMASIYSDDGEQLVEICRRVKACGLTTSVDLAMPDPNGPAGAADWERILERSLPYVDVFMPSGDELLYALDRDRFGEGDNLTASDLAPLSERLLEMGVAISAIKLGPRGIYVRTGTAEAIAGIGGAAPSCPEAWANRELWFPVYEVDEVVGATGAGDTTIAGFLAALLRDELPTRCGCIANAVGSFNVQVPDALSGIKSWEETVAALDGGWKHDPFSVDEPGWRRDPDNGVWHGPNDQA
ncbi:MAG: carbohydrate kinase family protein [Lentisphaerae bacterium]|jgi:sugar/nucleoside kinase (ribokinase family)|nr:carbohydrate kinase family protein [Lentisphaerota bacterium]MBT5604721.1 carbohydrate kinase family protein [Lentisphaerota bacterium]MBT7058105.1 carbohydrate kinase family protein [Lentisphaerota bacterium]MBT7841793.1 carbohydrate kinase family protein [Lentisphaerota bacterium]